VFFISCYSKRLEEGLGEFVQKIRVIRQDLVNALLENRIQGSLTTWIEPFKEELNRYRDSPFFSELKHPNSNRFLEAEIVSTLEVLISCLVNKTFPKEKDFILKLFTNLANFNTNINGFLAQSGTLISFLFFELTNKQLKSPAKDEKSLHKNSLKLLEYLITENTENLTTEHVIIIHEYLSAALPKKYVLMLKISALILVDWSETIVRI
jgi:hypothetical protein